MYPFSIKTSKCSGICRNINDPYAKSCVPYVVKNIIIKIFKQMSRNNERKHLKWQETCTCKCRLDSSVCNSKQRYNKNKFRCECKELIDIFVIKDFFETLVILNMNVINHMMLENI